MVTDLFIYLFLFVMLFVVAIVMVEQYYIIREIMDDIKLANRVIEEADNKNRCDSLSQAKPIE